MTLASLLVGGQEPRPSGWEVGLTPNQLAELCAGDIEALTYLINQRPLSLAEAEALIHEWRAYCVRIANMQRSYKTGGDREAPFRAMSTAWAFNAPKAPEWALRALVSGWDRYRRVAPGAVQLGSAFGLDRPKHFHPRTNALAFQYGRIVVRLIDAQRRTSVIRTDFGRVAECLRNPAKIADDRTRDLVIQAHKRMAQFGYKQSFSSSKVKLLYYTEREKFNQKGSRKPSHPIELWKAPPHPE